MRLGGPWAGRRLTGVDPVRTLDGRRVAPLWRVPTEPREPTSIVVRGFGACHTTQDHEQR